MAQYLNQISQSGECGSKALEQQHPAVADTVLAMLRKLKAHKVPISKTINNCCLVCVLFLLGNSKYNLVQLIMEKKRVSGFKSIQLLTEKSIAK